MKHGPVDPMEDAALDNDASDDQARRRRLKMVDENVARCRELTDVIGELSAVAKAVRKIIRTSELI